MQYCDALGKIREAAALLRDEAKTANSRELSMVLTKLDEAVLWRQHDMQMKAAPVNHVCVLDDEAIRRASDCAAKDEFR